MVEVPNYDEFLFEELEHAAEQTYALERLARVELLRIVRSLVAHDSAIGLDGCRSVGAWLAMRLGMSQGMASAIERVATATGELPAILAAFESGTLSWDKLVLVCAFADVDTDEQFARESPSMTINQLTMLARRAQNLSDEDTDDVHAKRYLRFSVSRNGLSGRISAFMPIEDFLTARTRLESVGNEKGRDENGSYIPAQQLNADALVEICSTQLAQESFANSNSLVITADVEILRDIGLAEIDYEGILAPETVRRALCSASVELAVMDGDRTIGSGRATRLFPPKVLKALMTRDKGCRFPGCQRRRWLHGHHVREWENGGHSDEDNGIILCDTHHRFVHEKHWRIRGSVYGALEFIRPDGRVYAGVAPVPTERIRETFDTLLERAS